MERRLAAILAADVVVAVMGQTVAMLLDQQYEELQKICADSRSAAEKGDFEEAHRLFTFARDLLDEESNISGTE